MDLTILTTNKEKSGKMKVSDTAFAQRFNEPLVHQVVTAYLAGRRSGTKGQKNRSAVSGGGSKPWRQKGTGRARAGTIRSPLWRGGGKVFAASTRDYTQKVPTKMYRAAMRAIFSELVRQDRFKVIKTFELKAPKTRDFVACAKSMDFSTGLLVLDTMDTNVLLAARNIPHVAVCDVKTLDPVSLVGAKNVFITEAAVRKVEEWLG